MGFDRRRLQTELLRAAQELAIPGDLARALFDRLARRLCGSERDLTPAERAQRIRAEWDGRNLTELMLRYRCSRATVYRALGKQG
jgi:Mor family transcriptional regulator